MLYLYCLLYYLATVITILEQGTRPNSKFTHVTFSSHRSAFSYRPARWKFLAYIRSAVSAFFSFHLISKNGYVCHKIIYTFCWQRFGLRCDVLSQESSRLGTSQLLERILGSLVSFLSYDNAVPGNSSFLWKHYNTPQRRRRLRCACPSVLFCFVVIIITRRKQLP